MATVYMNQHREVDQVRALMTAVYTILHLRVKISAKMSNVYTSHHRGSDKISA